VLALTASLTAEGPVRLGFFAGLGRRFQVESSDDLQAWAAVGAPVVGQGRPAAVLDDRPRAGVASRSYRVRALGVAAPPGMAWIPPGTFTMGSPDAELGRSASEGPQKQVAITREFWLGRTEVTQGEYQALMGENPAWFLSDTNLPVENVTWMDATNYCAQLTARERAAGNLPLGYQYRLPTEAEWEYACRAGTATATAFGESLSARQANFDGNYPYGGGFKWFYRERTQAVGSFPANGWGLVDLHGNVLEWCQDWYTNRLDWDTNAVAEGVVADPQGPPAGTERVVRGGAWRSRGEDCRSAWRTGTSRWNANYALGFRVALGPVAGYGQGVIAGSVVWQGGEEPLPEVAMGLYDLENPPVGNQPAALLASTLTGLDGSYAFTNLPPGHYGVWPLETAEAGGLRFQWETNSASPKVALVAGTNTVNFTAEDLSLFEGDAAPLTITIYYDATRYTNGCQLAVHRRYFSDWFGHHEWFGAISNSCTWNHTNTIHGLGWIQLQETAGEYWFLKAAGRENVFSVVLLPVGGAAPVGTLISLPMEAYPANAIFAWDVVGGRGSWLSAGLAAPAAKAATKLEFPGRFTAQWEAVAGAFGYVVEVSTQGSFTENNGRPTLSIDTGAATGWAFDLPEAIGNRLPYFYRVIAYGDHVLSPYSAAVRVGLDGVAAPMVLPASGVTFTGFTANWAPLAGALGYRLDVSADPQFATYILRDADMGTNTAFSLASLAIGGYYYRVRAVAEGLTTANSAVICANFPGMAWIPAGTFTMGCYEGEKNSSYWEKPRTVVTITKGFWMSRCETTQAEYEAVLGKNPSYFNENPQCPVENVTWDDASWYCYKLTERERAEGRLPGGHVYRLPTEAEWEYACRAGTTTRFSFGEDDMLKLLWKYAWYRGYSGKTTRPVGQKLPNAWGLHDMHGNVREWCQDWAGRYPGGSVVNPQGLNTANNRVNRGGDWLDYGSDCRSATRNENLPAWRDSRLGFRPVLASVQ
jgi:formylglycine-generating enzyme required for sulfatase activity